MEKTQEQMDIEFCALLRRISEKGMGMNLSTIEENLSMDFHNNVEYRIGVFLTMILTSMSFFEYKEGEFEELTENDSSYIVDTIMSEHKIDKFDIEIPDNMDSANKVLNQFKLYSLAYS